MICVKRAGVSDSIKKKPLLYLVILQLAGALCYAHAYIRGLLVERIKDNLLRELMIDVPP